MAYARPNYDGDEDDETEESWLRRVRERDALIVYEEDDEYEVFKTVLAYFNSRDLSYALPQIDYPGGNVMPSTSKAIENAKKVLLILSQNSNNANFSLETFLALEKCLKYNKLCLTILTLRGFERKNIASIPMLQNATIVELDYNRQEICLEAVIRHIKDDDSGINELIPAGNFATGLAWSHFTGYLKIILPEIPTLIRESTWYRENPGRFIEKLFILLPRSGRTTPLTDDPRITSVGNLSHKATVDGSPRVYNPAVYCVSADDDQKYYCCAEIPSAFGTIGKVFEEILEHITAQQRVTEVERFYYKLQEILNHQLNERVNGTVEVIMYDDEQKDASSTPSHQLISRYRREATGEQPPNTFDMKRKFKNDVCLLYAACDSKHATKVRATLQDKGKTVVKVQLPDQNLHETEQRLTSAAWVVLFMSEDAMSMSKSECMPLWMANILSSSLEENELRVIPVLIDSDPKSIPDFIRWVTYISIQEDGYQDRILDIINGKPISMKWMSPVGNVAYGLAMAFFMNYLQYALTEIPRRCKEKLKEISADPEKCVCKVFEFIPLSGKTLQPLEEIQTDKYGIEKFGSVRPVQEQVASVRRQFNVNMYGIYKKSEPSVYVEYFIGEYAAPLRTLRHMHESFIAGLNNAQFTEQIKMFKEELDLVLRDGTTNSLSDIRNVCTPILYDDKEENLIDVLMKIISKVRSYSKVAGRVGRK